MATSVRYFAALAALILLVVLALATYPSGRTDGERTVVTIATVNNRDMTIMQRLSPQFEAANPDIVLEWLVLEENILRQRVTTDIAVGGGQFDVITIGTYETPIWSRLGWLRPITGLPEDYDLEDVLRPVRDALSHDDTLFALPFYAESTMTYYRRDLFRQAGLEMPNRPTYDEIARFARLLTDRRSEIYGICLRGKAGWGENVAYITTLVNTFGGRWFDLAWRPEIDSPEWTSALKLYLHLLQSYGPPGASSNGFNENLALFATGHCAMWIDATVAAGMLLDSTVSRVSEHVGFAHAPIARTEKGSRWLWSWALASPTSSDAPEAALRFMRWATSKEYVALVGSVRGWHEVPPGTRYSTYDDPRYQEAAPFAQLVLESILSADPVDNTLRPSPYTGIQYVGIPEFQAMGARVGQSISGVLSGSSTLEASIREMQNLTHRTMRRAGYLSGK